MKENDALDERCHAAESAVDELLLAWAHSKRKDRFAHIARLAEIGPMLRRCTPTGPQLGDFGAEAVVEPDELRVDENGAPVPPPHDVLPHDARGLLREVLMMVQPLIESQQRDAQIRELSSLISLKTLLGKEPIHDITAESALSTRIAKMQQDLFGDKPNAGFFFAGKVVHSDILRRHNPLPAGQGHADAGDADGPVACGEGSTAVSAGEGGQEGVVGDDEHRCRFDG